MLRSPLRGNRVSQALFLLWVAGVLVYSTTQLSLRGGWTVRAEIIAFLAGAGGAALMFFRWRRYGDRLAQVLCLAAFGTWILAVLTLGVGGAKAGKPGSLGFDVAAAALLIGFIGGVIVLIRRYVDNARDRGAPPQ